MSVLCQNASALLILRAIANDRLTPWSMHTGHPRQFHRPRLNRIANCLTRAEIKQIGLDNLSHVVDQAVSQAMSQALVSFLRPAGKLPCRHRRPGNLSLGLRRRRRQAPWCSCDWPRRPGWHCRHRPRLLSLQGHVIRPAQMSGVTHTRPAGVLVPASACSDVCPRTRTRTDHVLQLTPSSLAYAMC